MQNGRVKKRFKVNRTKNRRPKRRDTNSPFVAITIPDVPREVHNKLKDYKLKIIGKRKKNFILMEAYREFLIEATRTISI